MASANDKPDSKKPDFKEGRLNVIHRPKHDKNISDEPEMKELKRMIRKDELDPDRTIDHLEEEENSQ